MKTETKKLKAPKAVKADKKVKISKTAEAENKAVEKPAENKITRDTLISDVLTVDENLAETFFEFGMHCLGCPIANGESIGEAAAAHGIDVDKLLEALNAKKA